MFSVGAFDLTSMNLAMGFALGCCMQFYGSIIAFMKGEFASAFAFAAYAFFWFSFGMTLLLPVSRSSLLIFLNIAHGVLF